MHIDSKTKTAEFTLDELTVLGIKGSTLPVVSGFILDVEPVGYTILLVVAFYKDKCWLFEFNSDGHVWEEGNELQGCPADAKFIGYEVEPVHSLHYERVAV